MLPITLNPYLDAILKEHVIRQARRHGLPLEALERAFDSEAAAVEFLKACGGKAYEDYVDDASAAVDHVGWILVDKATGVELPA